MCRRSLPDRDPEGLQANISVQPFGGLATTLAASWPFASVAHGFASPLHSGFALVEDELF